MDAYEEVPLGERMNGQMNMPSARRGEENGERQFRNFELSWGDSCFSCMIIVQLKFLFDMMCSYCI